MECHDREYYEHGQEERPGVIGTILKSVAETLANAKEDVIGKSSDYEPREGGYEEQEEEEGTMDRAVEKAGEAKEAVKEKAKETAEWAKEKARGAKEMVKEKAERTKETVKFLCSG